MIAFSATPVFAAGGERVGGVFDLPGRWDLSIYTVIVFLILLGLMFKFAWPAITAGMQAREDLITSARDEAIKAKQEAEAIRVELQAKMAKAQDEVKALIEEARKDAEKLRATEREVGVKEAAAERDRAKREIETAKEQAMAELNQHSVKLAAMIAGKAIKREVSPADHTRLIEESLTELQASVN
ncbi:MAG: F0F1 ATP synthase subunit B [Fimbriiglobus sp.]